MKIALDDIKASPKQLSYTEDVDELNTRLGRGVQDFRVTRGLQVDVEYYRAGLELFFAGTTHGEVHGSCARCLEDYAFAFERPFRFVLTPRAAGLASHGREGARLRADDLELSQYEGDQIDLTPLVHEQMILALPTRPLCGEACRGLCSQCGANLNAGPCGCPAAPRDPRLAVLHGPTHSK
jgi:uncharacterized protein